MNVMGSDGMFGVGSRDVGNGRVVVSEYGKNIMI